MKNKKRLVSLLLSLGLANHTYALTCPAYDVVKNVHFVWAYPHKNDPQLWYLLSETFQHDQKTWNISLGMFFYKPTTVDVVLQKGQEFYQQAPLKRRNPEPIWIPGGVVCEYMPEGSDYFVSAVSPPESSF